MVHIPTWINKMEMSWLRKGFKEANDNNNNNNNNNNNCIVYSLTVMVIYKDIQNIILYITEKKEQKCLR